MKKISIVFLFVLVSISLKAQYNLVPNPSFEVFDTCPHNPGRIHYAIPWTNPLNSSPDYMNACDTTIAHSFGVPSNYAGFEPAHTGSGYALIAIYTNGSNPLGNNYREYIEVQLTDSLIGGVDYCIRFYVSVYDSSGYVSNNIAIYFSNIQIQDTCYPIPCNLPYIPQFENPSTNNLDSRNGWTEISGTFTAMGGEKYIVIGNFRDSSSTVVTPTYWTSGPQGIYGGYYVDDVLVTPCDSLTAMDNYPLIPSSIKLFPSIAVDEINIVTKNELISQLEIFSSIGQNVYSQIGINVRKISINISTLAKGVYILNITTDKKSSNLKFIKK